jgi:hypothetical protein
MASNELLPRKLAPIGGIMVYSFLTFFLLITASEGFWLSSTEKFEEDTLSANYRYFLAWPAAIGVLRIFFWLAIYRVESPQFFLESMGPVESSDAIKKNLDKIYSPKDASIIHNYVVGEFNKKSSEKKVSPSSMFTGEYRKRFAAGVAVNVLQQLSGVNFFVFYSKNIFDDISGNGDMVNL